MKFELKRYLEVKGIRVCVCSEVFLSNKDTKGQPAPLSSRKAGTVWISCFLSPPEYFDIQLKYI